MQRILIHLICMIFSQQLLAQKFDFSSRSDLEKLGSGKIHNHDKTEIRSITIYELKSHVLIYQKKGSLHDLEIGKIDRIDFPESLWGPARITFTKENTPVLEFLLKGGYVLPAVHDEKQINNLSPVIDSTLTEQGKEQIENDNQNQQESQVANGSLKKSKWKGFHEKKPKEEKPFYKTLGFKIVLAAIVLILI